MIKCASDRVSVEHVSVLRGDVSRNFVYGVSGTSCTIKSEQVQPHVDFSELPGSGFW